MNKFSKLFLGSILALSLSACGGTTEKVKVTFDYNYETFDETATSPAATVVEVVKGESVAKPAEDPVWEGHRFTQWCTTMAAVQAFDFSAKIQKDTTIYAGWQSADADFDTWALVGSFDPSHDAGSGDQWNPNSETYKLATEDGIHYSISDVTLKNVEFKVVKDHDWNAAPGPFGGAHVNAEASTASCFSDNGGNIKIELPGVYTVDVDLSNATKPVTLTRTQEINIQTLGYSFNILGAHNGWQPQNDDVTGENKGHLNGDVALSGTWTGTVALDEGQAFKLTYLKHTDDGAKTIVWLAVKDDATPNITNLIDETNISKTEGDDPNFLALKHGDYTFTVTVPAAGPSALTVSVSVVETEKPTEKPMYETVGLVGSNNSWGGDGLDTPFVQADPTKREYTLTADLVENGEYKVRPENTWSGDLGYDALTAKPDETLIVGANEDGVSGNIKCLVAGSYDFVLKYDVMNVVTEFTVAPHAGGEQKQEVVVTFTAGVEKGTQTGQGSYTETLEKEGVTLVATDSPMGLDANYRIYKDKTLAISVAEGAKIKSVVLNGNDSSKKVSGFSALEGLVIDADANVATFTGDVDTVTFTAGGAQVRLGSIVVTVVK